MKYIVERLTLAGDMGSSPQQERNQSTGTLQPLVKEILRRVQKYLLMVPVAEGGGGGEEEVV